MIVKISQANDYCSTVHDNLGHMSKLLEPE